MSNLRKILVKTAESIEKNRDKGFFGHKRFRGVPWLEKDPQTVEEIADNLAMRLEAGGFELVFKEENINKETMGRFIANAASMPK